MSLRSRRARAPQVVAAHQSDEPPQSVPIRPSNEQLLAAMHVMGAHAAVLREKEVQRRRERRAKQKRLSSGERALAGTFLVVAVCLGVMTWLSLGVVGDDVLDTVRGLDPGTVPQIWWVMDAYYLGARWCVLMATGFLLGLLGWAYYISKRYFTAHGFYASERIAMPISVGALFGLLGLAASFCLAGGYAFFIENVHLLAFDADPKTTPVARYPPAWHGSEEQDSSMWIAWQFFIAFVIASAVAVSYTTSRLVLAVGAGATDGIKEYFAQWRRTMFDWREKRREQRSIRGMPASWDDIGRLVREAGERT